jgi:hypothetical protein
LFLLQLLRNPPEAFSVLQGVVGMGNFHFICNQCKYLIALFKIPEYRISMAVKLYRRVLDPHNWSKVMRLLPWDEQVSKVIRLVQAIILCEANILSQVNILSEVNILSKVNLLA